MSREPFFSSVDMTDPAYRAAIAEARSSLSEFRLRCKEASETGALAFIKKEVRWGEHRALLWLSPVRLVGDDFEGTVFEVPAEFDSLRTGQIMSVESDEVLDWMVNDGGRLHGGFSLRYQRSRLAPEKQPWFDQRIGVIEYV
jgi:uncharacterized protein YegJ (DUF2314 family)